MRHQRNRLIDLNMWEHITRSNLLRSMLTNLIKSGHITTTNKKALAVKAYADNFFSRLVAYGTSEEGRRNAIAFVKSVVFTEEEGKKALFEITPRLIDSKRTWGYTEMYKIGFRKGDTAEITMIKIA